MTRDELWARREHTLDQVRIRTVPLVCVSVVGIVQSSTRGTGERASEESDASTVAVAYVGPPGPLRATCFTGTRVDSEGGACDPWRL